MKVEFINQEENRLSFLVRGINYNIANALRRYNDEIYVLAVDNVEIASNDSSMFDEVLAHRLGLIPLIMDKTFTPKDKCSCKGKGCLKCTANLTLRAEGPKTVYASDLKSRTIKPVYPDMPLVWLEKGQNIELVAQASLGQAKKHSKFSSCLIWYRACPQITIKDCKNSECIDICPQKVFDMENGKITVKNLLACDLCNACSEQCKKIGIGSINVSGSNEDFIFMIESWGQMSPKNIFSNICEKVDEDLACLAKEVKKID